MPSFENFDDAFFCGMPTLRCPHTCAACVHIRVPISERGNDKSGRVSEVLVTIGQLRVDHASHDVLLLPVVTHLTQPVEVCLTGHL